MPIHVRYHAEAVVVSNLARTMNDPRYSSAGDEIAGAIELGHQRWILELGDVRDAGSPFLGLLMTLTRRIRQSGGEVVLADVSRSLDRVLAEMQLDEYWDRYDSVDEALRQFPV